MVCNSSGGDSGDGGGASLALDGISRLNSSRSTVDEDDTGAELVLPFPGHSVIVRACNAWRWTCRGDGGRASQQVRTVLAAGRSWRRWPKPPGHNVLSTKASARRTADFGCPHAPLHVVLVVWLREKSWRGALSLKQGSHLKSGLLQLQHSLASSNFIAARCQHEALHRLNPHFDTSHCVLGHEHV
jgi:hypothetical protein